MITYIDSNTDDCSKEQAKMNLVIKRDTKDKRPDVLDFEKRLREEDK